MLYKKKQIYPSDIFTLLLLRVLLKLSQQKHMRSADMIKDMDQHLCLSDVYRFHQRVDQFQPFISQHYIENTTNSRLLLLKCYPSAFQICLWFHKRLNSHIHKNTLQVLLRCMQLCRPKSIKPAYKKMLKNQLMQWAK